MKMAKVQELLGASLILENSDYNELDFEYACGSDLMSDVMAFVRKNVILLTGLVTPQVVRTVEMMDIKVIIFVRGKIPNTAVTDLATDKDVAILSTELTMFEACGRLYEAGLRSKFMGLNEE